MKQATVKLPSGEWLLWPVCDDAINFEFGNKDDSILFYISKSCGLIAEQLPPGNWQLLGADPTALTEEEAKEIVEHYSEKPKFVGDKSRTFYKDYRTGSLLIMIPTASLDSLAASLQISKPFVVLKNIEK